MNPLEQANQALVSQLNALKVRTFDSENELAEQNRRFAEMQNHMQQIVTVIGLDIPESGLSIESICNEITRLKTLDQIDGQEA